MRIRRPRTRHMLAAAGVILAALLAACAAPPAAPPSAPTPPAPAPRPGGTVIRPGLYDLGNGRKRAVGYLVHRTIEGGFWAVTQTAPGQAATSTTNVAVLVGAEGLGVDLKALDGRYVAAEGTALNGVSTRMAGPEIGVRSIAPLTDSVPNP